MGNWGSYLYDSDTWSSYDSPAEMPEPGGGRFIRLILADSDLAEVQFQATPSEPPGSAFVGYTPRSYFEDPSAPGCTDAQPQAVALAAWATNGVSSSDIAPMLAIDGVDGPDACVEETLDRLMAALGLPTVPW